LSCKETNTKTNQNDKIVKNEIKNSFELNYIYSGLGSNMNSKLPVFIVKENKFIYTLEENSSWNGEFSKTPDTICIGNFRVTSADSISQIIEGINDSQIYETSKNIIMSGGIDNILIKNEQKELEITLHNATHPTAQKIIDILNSNIPNQFNKINLWENNLGHRTKANVNWTDLGKIKIDNKEEK